MRNKTATTEHKMKSLFTLKDKKVYVKNFVCFSYDCSFSFLTET